MTMESADKLVFPQYSLSQKDFENPPSTIGEYKVGDKVTRENFVSLLIKSFAVSRGKSEVQIMFLDWIKAKYGFDYLATMNSFSNPETGCWKLLSEDERKKFLDTFRRISKHTDKWMDFEHEDEIINELLAITQREILKQIYEHTKTFFDFDAIKSEVDFVNSSRVYFGQLSPSNTP